MNTSSRTGKQHYPTFKLTRTAAGMLAVGVAIAISSFNVVRAEHAQPNKSKIYACSAGTACLEGHSTSNSLGILGISAGTAIEGLTSATNGNAAVAGLSYGTSGGGAGIYGSSASGPGVYGTSSASEGVYGTSAASEGVYGSSSSGYGVEGYSATGVGVFAESADNARNAQASTLYAQSDSVGTYPFAASNIANGQWCVIDPFANLYCTGSTDTKAVRVRHVNTGGQHVLAYAAESVSSTLEDFGTARLVGGVTKVSLEPGYASTIDPRAYRVFLTPMGDTRGLFVSAKTPSGFEVREAQGGRSTLSFDYRIVARPLDAKNDRLPLAPARSRPRSLHRSPR